MFGYIRPLECELRVREQLEYRAYYCGLCKAIGSRYGLIARLALNYDCAFLGAFLGAQRGDSQFERRRCLCHLCRGKQPMAVDSRAIDYAADVNVLLAFCSACDGWQDERRLSSLLLRLLFGPAYRRAVKNQPELAQSVAASLAALAVHERGHTPCTDEPSDAFGTLMRAIILFAPGLAGAEQTACGWMFYNLGRWIYLADAWDDLEKDANTHAYNPFLAAGTTPEEAAFLLNVSLTEAQRGYDLVTMNGPHGLIDNIMELGCRARTRQLLQKRACDTIDEAAGDAPSAVNP